MELSGSTGTLCPSERPYFIHKLEKDRGRHPKSLAPADPCTYTHVNTRVHVTHTREKDGDREGKSFLIVLSDIP